MAEIASTLAGGDSGKWSSGVGVVAKSVHESSAASPAAGDKMLASVGGFGRFLLLLTLFICFCF